MTIDPQDPIFLPAAGAPRPELMLSAVLHLMSHYCAGGADHGGCVRLASVIERHLKALSGLPELSPVLRATCQQLCQQWAGVVERTLPVQPPVREPLLSRLMGRGRNAALPA